MCIDASLNIQFQGSSTLVNVTLEKDKNYINTANIGDSGYKIFRFVDIDSKK